MIFYDVELLSIPKIKYNCVMAAMNHHTVLPKKKGLFELCYIDSGDCVLSTPPSSLAMESGCLYPLLFAKKSEIYTEGDEPIKIYSIGIECDYKVGVIDSDKMNERDTRDLMKNFLSGNRFLIPRNGLSSNACEWLLSYVKKISSCRIGERIGEESRAISLLVEFMSRITASSMDEIAFASKAFPVNAVAYSEMAIDYITKNYRKKITVNDIADHLELTPNYLHAVFKQVKGTTIVDYLTTYRMNLARVYIERFGLKAYEAAELVGIDDPAYFSRIFKKLYGKSISEFKRESE